MEIYKKNLMLFFLAAKGILRGQSYFHNVNILLLIMKSIEQSWLLDNFTGGNKVMKGNIYWVA